MKREEIIETEEARAEVMEMEDAKKAQEDWLEMRLKIPVEYQGEKIEILDLTKIRQMTGMDLNLVYDLYMDMGGTRMVMQENTLLFAQIIASQASGCPLEAIQKINIKDSMLLKNKIYRFFYLSE